MRCWSLENARSYKIRETKVKETAVGAVVAMGAWMMTTGAVMAAMGAVIKMVRGLFYACTVSSRHYTCVPWEVNLPSLAISIFVVDRSAQPVNHTRKTPKQP